jgi:FHS family Na+ dependent glucose MFS transporter 1
MPVLLKLPSPKIAKNEKENGENIRIQGAAVLFVMFFFFYVASEATFGGWIYTYMIEMNLADAVSAAYLNSAFWAALIVGRIISIPLATRASQVRIMKWNMVGAIMSVAIIVVGQISFNMILLGSMGLGLSFASMFPSMLSIADKYIGVSGKVMGWFFTGASVGAMTVPWIIGQFFESVGPQAFIWGILTIIGMSLVSFVMLERKFVRN